MIETSITKWIKKKIRRLIGIVEDGDTAIHSIASGKYVVWKGDLYKASTAIAIGTTLSTSNLTAVSDGGLNEINGNLAKSVTNGNVTTGHIYCVHLSESTIASAHFDIIYNPSENMGTQEFSICLTNGTNIYCCTARISLSNGTLSLSGGYRMETGASGKQSWSVSIRTIRMIA